VLTVRDLVEVDTRVADTAQNEAAQHHCQLLPPSLTAPPSCLRSVLMVDMRRVERLYCPDSVVMGKRSEADGQCWRGVGMTLAVAGTLVEW